MPWIRPLLLTLQLMCLSVFLSAVIGITLAFLISVLPRRQWSGRLVARFCLLSVIACIATPMILHAAAWEATAGKFGWMTFSQTASRTYTGLAGRYGGLVACVWIHGLFGAAIVSLATWFGTSRVDRDVIDQSTIDGGPIWTWWCIRLPIATPWVMTGLLATAILAATEMTVVDLYGVRTLADEFYLFYAAEPSIVSILMVLVLPSTLAIAMLCVLLLSRRRHADTRLLDRAHPTDGSFDLPFPVTLLAALVASAISTLMFAFPLGGLILKTGQLISVPTQPDQPATIIWSPWHAMETLASAPSQFSREYAWTALLAISTAALCVPIGWSIASVAWRRWRLCRIVDLLSLIIFLVPGPIVGLVIVRLFTLPVPGFHWLYHQTLIPTLVALSVRALPISYWIIRAGYAGIDSSILDLSRLDLPWVQRLWLVDRPLLAKPLLVAGCAAAVMASGDVPATLPVVPPGVVTVGTRLFALLHSGARSQEAALAFWYVCSVVLVSVALSFRWKRSVG